MSTQEFELPVPPTRRGESITLRTDQPYGHVAMVTWRQAQQWLEEADFDGRPLRQRRVPRNGAEDVESWIADGDWTLVPPGLCWTPGPDSLLINGQTRLTKQVELKVDLPYWLTYNVPFAAFALLDTGSKRNMQQVLYMARKIDVPSQGLQMSSALKLLCCFRRHLDGQMVDYPWYTWPYYRLSHSQMLLELDRHPDLMESVKLALRYYDASKAGKGRTGISAPAMAVLHRIMHDRYPKSDAKEFDDFLERVAWNKNMDETDGGFAFRRWWQNGAQTIGGDNSRTRRERALFGLVWAWNKHANHEVLKTLRVDIRASHSMPEPARWRKFRSGAEGSGARGIAAHVTETLAGNARIKAEAAS